LAYDIHDFMNDFGPSWYDFFYTAFFKILSSVMLGAIILIIILATRDYYKINEDFRTILREKYIQTILKSREVQIQFIEEPEEVNELTSASNIFNPENRPDPIITQDLDELADDISSEGILGAINEGNYSELPDLYFDDSEITEFLVAVKDRSKNEHNARRIRNKGQNTDNLILDEDFNAWDFKIKRQGNVYLKPTLEMVEEKEKIRGWRDSDEISIAMQGRESMIEYCYQREAKNYSVLNGYVLIRFTILHTGVVDPASVRIVESTLYNKRIEQCIKNIIKRFRGFEELDETMGSVAVIQKFIFN